MVFVLAFTENPITCLAKYENSNISAVWNGLFYKWVPTDWFAAYYLKEFDKVAPPPGANWMNDKTIVTAPWFDAAREKGWVVKTRAGDVKVGSIAIRRNPDKSTVMLDIVRKVYVDGFKSSYIGKDGEPQDRTVSFSFLLNTTKGYHFAGYIWPERVHSGK